MRNDEQNHETLENQLRLWEPRQPSAKVARRLFGRRAPEGWEGLRARVLLQLLTPVAACLVTVVVFVAGGGPRPAPDGQVGCATFYATVVAGSPLESNALRRTFAMDRSSVNMEWNVIPGFSYDGADPGARSPADGKIDTNAWTQGRRM